MRSSGSYSEVMMLESGLLPSGCKCCLFEITNDEQKKRREAKISRKQRKLCLKLLFLYFHIGTLKNSYQVTSRIGIFVYICFHSAAQFYYLSVACQYLVINASAST